MDGGTEEWREGGSWSKGEGRQQKGVGAGEVCVWWATLRMSSITFSYSKKALAPPPKAEIDARRCSAAPCDARRRTAAWSLVAASADEPSMREPSHAASAGASDCSAPSAATLGSSVQHDVSRGVTCLRRGQGFKVSTT